MSPGGQDHTQDGEGLGASLEKLIQRKKFQKARNPQNWAAQALEFQSFLMGRLPSFLNSFLCSEKEEAKENWRGRWQEPEKSSGLSQPSLPWQHCYFYPVVHGAQSSDFLSSKEARLASALIFQCSTFSKRLRRKK